MGRSRPIADSYWVDFTGLNFQEEPKGHLIAGEYPGAEDPANARSKLVSLLQAGVDLFIDLTVAGEYDLQPYARLAAFEAGERGVNIGYRRLAIVDASTPSRAEMSRILDIIDASLTEGHTVYVHCFGGIGRTGTVVGCWLVRHGLTGRQAVAKIGAWRRGTPDGWRVSPETQEQMDMILSWAEV